MRYYPIGSIGERTAFVQNSNSVNPARQSHAHAHSIRVDPSNRFVLAADLGLDKLFVYRFDQMTGELQPNDPPFATVAPGSGPRHVVFHPSGRIAYLINEMGSTIIRFGWDSNRGVLTPQYETVSTLPKDFTGTSTCAEILVHPSGKFLLRHQPRTQQRGGGVFRRGGYGTADLDPEYLDPRQDAA